MPPHDFQVQAARAGLVLLPVACILAVLPLLMVVIPPLHDYPFHVARADALASLFGQVAHPTHYRLGSLALPNEAMDIVTLGLTAFLPPLVAGRVFLGLVLVVLLTGVVALHRALHGRFSPWPLLAGLFLYSWIFLYGFENYLFGIGLMLWSLAAWIAMADAAPALRLAVATLLAVLLLFCHLVAFGLFAVGLGGLALSEMVARRRRDGAIVVSPLLRLAVPIGLTFALFVLVSPTAGEAQQPFAYHGWLGWKPLMARRTPLSSIPWLDAATIVPAAAVVAWLAWRRRLTVAVAAILPVVLVGICFLVMPNQLFGAQYADVRLPIVVLLLAIAAVDLRPLPPRGSWAVALLFVALLAVRSAVIGAGWQATAPVLQEFADAFDRLPQGSTLYAAISEPYPSLAYDNEQQLARWHPPLKHVVSLASVGRDVFVPSTWANPRQQPIRVLPRHEAAKRLQGDNPFITPDGVSLAAALAGVRALGGRDVFLLLIRPAALRGDLPAGMPELARGSAFVLWRVL